MHKTVTVTEYFHKICDCVLLRKLEHGKIQGNGVTQLEERQTHNSAVTSVTQVRTLLLLGAQDKFVSFSESKMLC